ncbi:MAG: hypothetical protein K8F92_13960 [Hyphomicrobium sp.]|nr:hypothetical protein [Hyphomicrobium sp.]
MANDRGHEHRQKCGRHCQKGSVRDDVIKRKASHRSGDSTCDNRKDDARRYELLIL